mmetsp:Transcript_82896/g.239517  ORF Transcript_82896/g.239517 Transcript_82896/m.239517 type:complete len:224 (-) Transcript_82896:205-876(-)
MGCEGLRRDGEVQLRQEFLGRAGPDQNQGSGVVGRRCVGCGDHGRHGMLHAASAPALHGHGAEGLDHRQPPAGDHPRGALLRLDLGLALCAEAQRKRGIPREAQVQGSPGLRRRVPRHLGVDLRARQPREQPRPWAGVERQVYQQVLPPRAPRRGQRGQVLRGGVQLLLRHVRLPGRQCAQPVRALPVALALAGGDGGRPLRGEVRARGRGGAAGHGARRPPR